MKRYEKLIQADKRGQVVIPKEVRTELGISETTGFYVYVVEGEGIFLKQVTPEPIEDAIDDIKEHAKKLGVSPEALKKTIEAYAKKKGGLEDL